MSNQRLQYLFDLYVQGSITPAEKRELSALALAKQHDTDVQELLDGYWDVVRGEVKMPEEKTQRIIQSILQKETKTPRIYKLWWAAAAVLILLAGGTYFLFFNKNKQTDIASTAPASDVQAPANNRAMITLADGRTIYLDSVSNGQLALQGNIKVIKLANGQIAYETAGGEVKVLQYNTLHNPRGSKVIDMQLSDGSHVWLNAGSSVTYPVAFISNERKVIITGEAYFEVAHNKAMPFKVTKGDIEVTVLGTHFNVHAYDDDAEIQITLLEGSIEVENQQQTIRLKPGQQAIAGNNGQLIANQVTDMEKIMAWKDNNFIFSGDNIQSIMRQLARWYDIEVRYDPGTKLDRHFTGIISRNNNISEVLKLLQRTEQIKFDVEGHRVIVSN